MPDGLLPTAKSHKRGFALHDQIATLGVRGLGRRWLAFLARHRPQALARILSGEFKAIDLGLVPDLPARGFEDCAWLFACGLQNRGIIRMDFDEAAMLFSLARRFTSGSMLEIGRRRGGSTIVLAIGGGEASRLTSIDIAPTDDGALEAALLKLRIRDRVELVVADANQVSPSAGGYDLIFVDGDHTYEAVRKDYVRWGRAVRPGGVLVFHDAWPNRPMASVAEGVNRLVNEISAEEDPMFARLPAPGSLAVFERVSSGSDREDRPSVDSSWMAPDTEANRPPAAGSAEKR